MAIISFRKPAETSSIGDTLRRFITGASLEVMPRTASKIEDFREILSTDTRIYIAHIDGTPIDEMVATAKRLTDEGFTVMPHVPGRIIPDLATFETWLKRYRDEAGVSEALVLAGGVPSPAGPFDSAIALLQTGLFDKHGFTRLHVAGHPEGNPDIDAKGATTRVDEAVMWKTAFAERTDADMAIVTQFAFEADPIIAWAERLAIMGVTLPIHIGLAGPAKLQTLIKYAIACGVGPSLSVLQKRAKDLTKLLLPFEPDEITNALAVYKDNNPDSLIAGAHIFPLGGIRPSADWLNARTEIEAPRTASGGS